MTRNILLLVVATLMAGGIAAAFIFKGDQILTTVGIDPKNPIASIFGQPEPVKKTENQAEKVVRALVYTRDISRGTEIQSGTDVTIDRFKEGDIGESPVTSQNSETDPEAFRRAEGRVLTRRVSAGEIVQTDHLRRPEPEPDLTSEPGYRAAVRYIDRLRELVHDPKSVFVPKRLVLSDDITGTMRFQETKRVFGGRFVEGRFVEGRVDVVESRRGGVSERIARNVPVKRVGFQDTRCGESRYYLQVPREAGDRIALAQMTGTIDRINLRAVDAPASPEKNRVCSGGRCRETPAPALPEETPEDAEEADPDAEGEDGEGEGEGEGEGDGQGKGEGDGASDGNDDGDPPAEGDGPDGGEVNSQQGPTDSGFALGREQASTRGSQVQDLYCQDGMLIDPRERDDANGNR